jgi:hypothetical protein
LEESGCEKDGLLLLGISALERVSKGLSFMREKGTKGGLPRAITTAGLGDSTADLFLRFAIRGRACVGQFVICRAGPR